MKVKDLIKELNKYDGEFDVAVHDAQEESVSMATHTFVENKDMEPKELVYVKGDHPLVYNRDMLTHFIVLISGG